MELISITLAANETKQFAKAGRYFEIIDAPNAIRVDFTGPNGNLTDTMTNAVSGLYLEDPYSHFAITNGVSAQTITLLLMETGRGGSRRQPGNVRVIDQSSDQTKALSQFFAINSTSSGTAGSVVGLSSPTKSIVIRQMRVGSDSAGALAFVYGTAVPAVAGGSSNPPQNKLLGSAAATAGVRYGTNASFPPSAGELPGIVVIGYAPASPGVLLEIPLKTPIIVPAGFFFGVASSGANKGAVFFAEFEEQ